jgi:hypothetical protein
MIEYVGWAATLVFTLSYFCREAVALRRLQMLGAVIWMAYGAFVHAAPVVVANALVLAAAAWTVRRAPLSDAG